MQPASDLQGCVFFVISISLIETDALFVFDILSPVMLHCEPVISYSEKPTDCHRVYLTVSYSIL